MLLERRTRSWEAEELQITRQFSCLGLPADCGWCRTGHWLVNPPTMQEMEVLSLGWEDHLKKEMATHFNILAWKIPWTEEPGRLQSMGSQRVGHDWTTSLSFFLSFPISGKEFCHVSPAMFHGGMLLQDLLFLTFQISYPINHWCLCHCLWGLSSVLRLGL